MSDKPTVGNVDRMVRELQALLHDTVESVVQRVTSMPPPVTPDSGKTVGMKNPMRAPGDLIVGGDGGAPKRLVKGADSQVLTVDPLTHLLIWADPAGGTGSLDDLSDVTLTSPADEDVLTYDSGAGEWINAPASGGTPFDLAAAIHAATSKPAPVDADETALVDSAASNVLKKLTWANVKATLKTYFDTLYAASTVTQYTDEMAQDAVGGALIDTSSIDLTYNDGANTMKADAIFGTTSGTVAQGNHTHTPSTSGGGGPSPGWKTGQYYAYIELYGGWTPATLTMTANSEVMSPIYVPTDLTVDRIAVYVQTLVASSTVRLGIRNVGSDGWPAGILLDAGTVSSATTGAKEITISQALTAGWYWLSAAPSAAVGLIGATNSAPNWLGVAAVSSSPSRFGFVSQSLSAGFSSLPAGVTSPSSGLSGPFVYLRAA